MNEYNIKIASSNSKSFKLKYQDSDVYFELNKDFPTEEKNPIIKEDIKFETKKLNYEILLKIWKIIKELLSIIVLFYFH